MSKLNVMISDHEDFDENSEGDMLPTFNAVEFADALVEALKEEIERHMTEGHADKGDIEMVKININLACKNLKEEK